MRKQAIIVATLLCTCLSSLAFQADPFKAARITVEYGQGRKAIFTMSDPGLARGMDRYKIPKVIGVEFVFANGKTATVSEEGLRGIEIKDLHSTMIETGAKEGTWFLTTRIKNKEVIANRVANDWVVLVFESYKYKDRWIERNSERNSEIYKAEQDGADQPATVPESKAEGKEKTKPDSKVRPQ